MVLLFLIQSLLNGFPRFYAMLQRHEEHSYRFCRSRWASSYCSRRAGHHGHLAMLLRNLPRHLQCKTLGKFWHPHWQAGGMFADSFTASGPSLSCGTFVMLVCCCSCKQKCIASVTMTQASSFRVCCIAQDPWGSIDLLQWNSGRLVRTLRSRVWGHPWLQDLNFFVESLKAVFLLAIACIIVLQFLSTYVGEEYLQGFLTSASTLLSWLSHVNYADASTGLW